MEPQEIQAQALQCAVTMGAAWLTESTQEIIAVAEQFEEFIAGPQMPADYPAKLTGASTLVDTRAGERAGIWGPNCAGCGHAAGMHTSKGCIVDGVPPHVYCECTRTEAEASAP